MHIHTYREGGGGIPNPLVVHFLDADGAVPPTQQTPNPTPLHLTHSILIPQTSSLKPQP